MILNELTDILSSYFCILVSHQSFKTPSYSHHSGVTTKTPCSHIQMAPSYTSNHYSTLFDITSYPYFALPSVQFSHSVVSDSLWPPDCSTPGLPVHHKHMELAHSHVHWVGDAIQPSHPLPSPSLPVFSLSQHQGLFSWVSFSHQVAKVLEFQLQYQSFQWIFRTDFL